MNTVAKILIVGNLVLAGAFLASAGNFLGQMDHWKNKYDTETLALQETIDQKQILIDQKISENATLITQSNELSAIHGSTEEEQFEEAHV